jgi:L-ascorbate metabolism protein UlaG (beta-lactamase superfamily)
MKHPIPEPTTNPRAIMRAETISRLASTSVLVGGVLFAAGAFAQPRFTEIRPLTNKEVRLQLSAPPGSGYRVDAATNPAAWSSLITLTSSASSLVLTDSAAAYLPVRFYRAEQLSLSNLVTGDHLPTSEGDVVVHPLYHASTLLTWSGKAIYMDPDDDAAYESTYTGMPKADLILVTHSHGDHFSSGKIEALRKTNTLIIVPQAVFTGLTTAQRTNAIVLANGASTNVMGLRVEAVPAHNGNHAVGTGNGYVLTIGGKRLYFSGDTGPNVPEIRALQSIDIAFQCMNTPFTMTPTEAFDVVRAFRPRVVYPYHYRNQSGTTTNAAYFRQIMGTDTGIEVRLRKWY